jgi:hypothetical protein
MEVFRNMRHIVGASSQVYLKMLQILTEKRQYNEVLKLLEDMDSSLVGESVSFLQNHAASAAFPVDFQNALAEKVPWGSFFTEAPSMLSKNMWPELVASFTKVKSECLASCAEDQRMLLTKVFFFTTNFFRTSCISFKNNSKLANF